MSIKLVRIIWISLLTILIAWLLWQAIVPSGRISYFNNFSKENYFIGELVPVDRIKNGHELTDEPVYFSVYTARTFYKAVVALSFETPTPALQVGLEINKALWQYDFKQIKEGTVKTTLEFNLHGASRKNGKYIFMISDPNLKQQNKSIIIKDVSIELNDL